MKEEFSASRWYALYVIIVLALTCWIIALTLEQNIPLAWIVVWSSAALTLLLVPKIPEAALFACIFMAYGAPFSSDDLSLLVDVYFLNATCSLALAGWFLFGRRVSSNVRHEDWLTGLIVVFVLWALITVGIALLEGTPWKPFPKHHPTKYYQLSVIFLLASRLLGDRGRATRFAAAVCVTVVFRALLQGDKSLYLDSYTSQLGVLLLPIGLLGLLMARTPAAKFAFGLLLLGLVSAVMIAQNRAALVGGIAIAVILIWHCRSNWRLTVLLLPAAIIIATYLLPTSYLDRFRALWEPAATHVTAGLDRSTAQGRIRLWEAGLQMVKDKPWVGVGAGNFPLFLRVYSSEGELLQAHSIVVGIAAEMGLPGLTLFLLVFVAAIFRAGAAVRPDTPSWPRLGGLLVQASLVGYLALGLFSTRHDLLLAYLLAGWAAALPRRPIAPK